MASLPPISRQVNQSPIIQPVKHIKINPVIKGVSPLHFHKKQEQMVSPMNRESNQSINSNFQSTMESIDDKKQLFVNAIAYSRRSSNQSTPLIHQSLQKHQSKSETQIQNLCTSKVFKKKNLNSIGQLEVIEQTSKINYKNFLDQKLIKRNEKYKDANQVFQVLQKLKTPQEDFVDLNSKLLNHQLKAMQKQQVHQQSSQLIVLDPIEINQKILKFNLNYKKCNKISDSNTHYQVENPLEIAMLKETCNSNLMPKKLGLLNNAFPTQQNEAQLIQEHCNKQSLDLSNQNISEAYAKVVSQALLHSEMNGLKTLKLKNSNLTTKSLIVISSRLPFRIEEVDLESNNLGSSDFGICINPLLDSKQYPKLAVLNLENNKINDFGFNQILSSVLNSNLTVLNLSKNNLTDVSSEGISQFLKESQDISELYLHWNRFSSQGGLAISQGVELNRSLQVLDLSYNGIGNPVGVNSAASIIKSCNAPHNKVKHLDLSFNHISTQETMEIQTLLKDNNMIFGLHFSGNEGDWRFDSRGFMVQMKSSEGSNSQPSNKHQRIQGLKCIRPRQNNTDINQDICWLCDGWEEVTFKMTAEQSSSFCKHPVFLHLDFEHYRPHYMDPDPDDNTQFILKRMCPPNRRIQFFFSDPLQGVLYYSQGNKTMSFIKNKLLDLRFYNKEATSKNQSYYASPSKKASPADKRANYFFQKQFFKLQYFDSTVIEYMEPFLVNWIETKPNLDMFTSDYDANTSCRPRSYETYFKINFASGWTFEKSNFSTYIRDSDDLIDKCFETDWENWRITKVLSTNTANMSNKVKCKSILKKQYNLLRIIYKYYSSFGMVGDIPAISQNLFFTIATKMKISDGKIYKISDIDYNFISVNSVMGKEKNYRNPEKSMIRFEFLEIFVRIACDKYIRSGQCKNAQDSLEQFFKNSAVVDTLDNMEDPQEWRDARYWIEECDIVINNYMTTIQEIWNKWANSKKTERRYLQTTKTMNIYEFIDLVKYFNLQDDLLTERDVYISFNLAMMTQADELTNDRFISMTFVEFLEALARLAEKKSMFPLGTCNGVYSASERQEILLQYKLESLLNHIKEFISEENAKKDKLKLNNNSQPNKPVQQEKEIVHIPLVPSIKIANLQQKNIQNGQPSTLSHIEYGSKDSIQSISSDI